MDGISRLKVELCALELSRSLPLINIQHQFLGTHAYMDECEQQTATSTYYVTIYVFDFVTATTTST